MFDGIPQPTDPAGPMSAPEPLRVELAPDLILPEQLQSGCRYDASLDPEKRLRLAVLEEAVNDFQRNVLASGAEAQRSFRNAQTWFEADDQRWPFSFVRICQAIGLDAAYVRAGLRRWRDAQRARALRGERVTRIQLRRVAGLRSKATGRAAMGRARSRW